VLGAIANATSELHVTTVVVCPTVCIHPVIIAHAAATTAQLFDGRFALGLGSGETLEDYVGAWPTKRLLGSTATLAGAARRSVS
jgi:alkanesulfonate monooxygenase SsuD/methylene tetrahydromethanopterin reductase-like flavin-dependent oxidoreductase (luciferase family)